jgi:hypothetical protein
MREPFGSAHFGSAQKALLLLVAIIAIVFPFFPVAAHGVINWYVTGVDDLLIFSATYLVAKKRGRTAYAIAGVLTAVGVMIALVGVMGEALSVFAQYAKWSAVVPLGYAAYASYQLFRNSEEDGTGEVWWMKYEIFGRAFFGFAANCLDDIALNTSMIAGVYSEQAGEYLSGIGFGAVTMVVLAALVGPRMKDYPALYIVGYLLAAGVIIFLG